MKQFDGQTTTTGSALSPLLSLPSELRLRILNYAIGPSTACIEYHFASNSIRVHHGNYPDFLTTCKTIYIEGIEIYHDHVTYRIDGHIETRQIKRLPRQFVANIKHVYKKVYGLKETWNLDFAIFPNLKSVIIDITACTMDAICVLLQSKSERLKLLQDVNRENRIQDIYNPSWDSATVSKYHGEYFRHFGLEPDQNEQMQKLAEVEWSWIVVAQLENEPKSTYHTYSLVSQPSTLHSSISW